MCVYLYLQITLLNNWIVKMYLFKEKVLETVLVVPSNLILFLLPFYKKCNKYLFKLSSYFQIVSVQITSGNGEGLFRALSSGYQRPGLFRYYHGSFAAVKGNSQGKNTHVFLTCHQ